MADPADLGQGFSVVGIRLGLVAEGPLSTGIAKDMPWIDEITSGPLNGSGTVGGNARVLIDSLYPKHFRRL